MDVHCTTNDNAIPSHTKPDPRDSTTTTATPRDSTVTLSAHNQQQDALLAYKAKKLESELTKHTMEQESRKAISAANARKAESEAQRVGHELELKKLEMERVKLDLEVLRLRFMNGGGGVYHNASATEESCAGNIDLQRGATQSSNPPALSSTPLQISTTTASALLSSSTSSSSPPINLFRIGIMNLGIASTVSVTTLFTLVCFKHVRKQLMELGVDVLPTCNQTSVAVAGALGSLVVLPSVLFAVGESVRAVYLYLHFVFS
ncbi:hypothetical protein BDR26DRAFT_877175, partial [Obelidium mucronatum]